MNTQLQEPAFKNKHNLNTLGGVPEGYIPFTLKDLSQKKPEQVLFFISINNTQARLIYKQLKVIDPTSNIIFFPGWDCLPYDRIGPSQEIINERIEAFCKLSDIKKNTIVILSSNAYLQKIPPKKYWDNKIISLNIGKNCDRKNLIKTLSFLGYKRSDTVYESGDFAVRGHIIDVFAIGQQYPVRIDFFDTEIESMRHFSIDTQTTLTSDSVLKTLIIKPASEVSWDENAIVEFRKRYQNIDSILSLDEDELYKTISEGRVFQGHEHWAPFSIPEEFISFESYLEDIPFKFYADYRVPDILEDQIGLCFDYYKARKNPLIHDGALRPLHPNEFYHIKTSFDFSLLSPFVETNDNDLSGRFLADFPSRNHNPDFLDDVGRYINRVLKNKHVYLSCTTEGLKNRVFEMLQQCGFGQELPTYIMPMEKGFSTNDYILISDQDILGQRQTITKIKNRSHKRFFQELNDITIGDLIVHKDHGIGRYIGLEALNVGGVPHDCLILEYSLGDKLYLPAENMELISRYGNDSIFTQLDKLGSSQWQNKKGKVKKRIELIADYLVQLAAKRSEQKSDILKSNIIDYKEFCHHFPYVETFDQEQAIEDVLTDLSSGKPMDRLICGDVGFGKTEVALRAAFVAVNAGKQVAIVTPTTLLCRQHTQTFMNRFQHTKYKVQQLSRLVANSAAKKITESLKKGDVDIVIGTHRLLSKNVTFKNLGLLIIDEEQHFGVNQKEKIKTLYPDVHALTLTATPIPRTLQMSLSGVRELSLITTPPIDRIPVRTFVLGQDPIILKEAILRELHRGGQIFYVCPHIKDQSLLEDILKRILPDLRFTTVNGSMSANELEDTIAKFCDRHYDLLLATNIIESGIDMPSVNTIILHNAHLFGLSQLYQLRGRVGRSKMQAYAYFTVPSQTELTEHATRRLKVLQSLDTLGAGFNLANHDLDIRGAGNILGEEQSGHIKEIGVELYQQLLSETILMIKAKESGLEYQKEWTPQINLGGAVLIPERYIQDLSLRLNLYKRLSAITEIDEINIFASELVDRFGKFPTEVRNLLHVCELKLLSKQTCVEKLDIGPKGFVITFYQDSFPNPVNLLKWLQSASMNKCSKFRNDQKIFISFDTNDIKKRYMVCQKFLLNLKEII